MILPQDFKEFVQLLKKNNAEYLIVGGYAVGAHGHPRYTGDLDIWLNISQENAENLMVVINEFGFGSLNIKIEDFLIENNIIQMGYPPLRIDLLTGIDGVTFENAYLNKEIIEMDGLSMNFISYEDLVKNKSASGRRQDISDIESLKKKKK